MSTKLMMTVMMIKYHDNDDGDEDGDGEGYDDADGDDDDDAKALLVQARMMIVMVVVVICRSAYFGSQRRRNSVLLSRAFYNIAPFPLWHCEANSQGFRGLWTARARAGAGAGASGTILRIGQYVAIVALQFHACFGIPNAAHACEWLIVMKRARGDTGVGSRQDIGWPIDTRVCGPCCIQSLHPQNFQRSL